MSSFASNTATYVLAMCAKQVDHYTNVINSCQTREQVQAIRPWIVDGFKSLHNIAENLPRRRRKLCLSVVDAAREYVLNVSLSKSLGFFHKEIEEAFSPECSESDMGEKIGSIFEGLAEMFPGSVCCKVTVERRKAAAEDPASGSPTQDPEAVPKPNSEPEPESSGDTSEELR